MTKITVINGDIAQVSANALITSVRSLRRSNGPVDEAIKRAAGSMFHDIAQTGDHAKTCRLVIAKAGDRPHICPFHIVIFMIDDLLRPLSELVKHGLDCAATAGLKTVSLPIVRCELPYSTPEKTISEVIDGLAQGIASFREEYDGGLDAITVVTHDHPELLISLTAKFAEHKLL